MYLSVSALCALDVQKHCGLGKSVCFFCIAFILYRKCLRTFTTAQQHLRRFP